MPYVSCYESCCRLSLADEAVNNPAGYNVEAFKSVIHPDVVLEGGAWEGSGFDHFVTWTQKNATAMSQVITDSRRIVASATVTGGEGTDLAGTLQLKWTATNKSDGSPVVAGVEATVVLEDNELDLFPKLKKASRRFLFKSEGFQAAFPAAN